MIRAIESRPRRGGKTQRRAIFGKVHILWQELRSDLRRGSEDYREQLIQFAEAELRLPAGSLGSIGELSNGRLCRLLNALSAERQQPHLAGANVRQLRPKRREGAGETPALPAAVYHLASNEQAWLIEKLFDYVGWSERGREGFLQQNFRRQSASTLTVRQARSCTMILFTVAASKDLKREHGLEKVSREQVHAYIPELKRRLGVGAIHEVTRRNTKG